jgi:hypothetical protein
MIKFRGSSDDIVIIDQHGNKDEYYGDGEDVFATFNVGGKMRVHAIYDGCWCFAPALIDEDVPLPEWPIAVEASGYSANLNIEAPEDVRVFQEKR